MNTLRWMAVLVAAGLFFVGCERGAVAPKAVPAAQKGATPTDPGAMGAGVDAPEGPAAGGAVAVKAPVQPLLTRMEAAPGGKLPELDWDFSTGRSTVNVDWPKDGGENNTYRVEGDFQFVLTLPDNQEFSGRVRQVEARQDEAKIQSVEITTAPESNENAHQHVIAMLAKLGGGEQERGSLEAWFGKVKSGDYSNLEIKMRNSYNRECVIHVLNDGTSERPWSVGMDMDWSQVCGCHG